MPEPFTSTNPDLNREQLIQVFQQLISNAIKYVIPPACLTLKSRQAEMVLGSRFP